MPECTICPFHCRVDRSVASGRCKAGPLPKVTRAALHHWEEPCISGSRGSGAVFFSCCNLMCIFCQNKDISRVNCGTEFTADGLADLFLMLQDQGAHNINLVTPTPHVRTIVPALRLAKSSGLSIPVVYNTNAYETPETIRSLAGLVDLYLPDLKYVTDLLSERFSYAPEYGRHAIAAIGEMYDQVGPLSIGVDGLALKGVLIRHLILPGCPDEARRVLDTIKEHFGADCFVSLMRQYTPQPGLKAPLNRKLTDREYDRVLDYCLQLGFSNVYTQDGSSAQETYTPDFIHSDLYRD